MLIDFNACLWLLSLSSWSLPSLLLAFTCTKREYCLCIQSLKPQSYSRWVHYTFLCGIYLPFQVNLYVPNSKPSNKHSVLYARKAHVSTRAVRIFHVRRVIFKRSRLRSSLTRKWLVTGMPSPMLYANQIKIIANRTPPGLLLVGVTRCFEQAMDWCLLVEGEYKLYHSVWEPPIMCVAWKISPSHSCCVDSESMPLKMLFTSILKSSSGTSTNPCFPLRRAYPFTFMLSHHPLIKKH